MNVLLDTQSLIWLLGSFSDDKLGPEAKQTIGQAEVVYASAVSVLEIQIKTMLGKLQAPTTLVHDIAAAGLDMLSFSAEHAEVLNDFPALARHDPFDRMLLSQTKLERCILITSDHVLLEQQLGFVIDARL